MWNDSNQKLTACFASASVVNRLPASGMNGGNHRARDRKCSDVDHNWFLLSPHQIPQCYCGIKLQYQKWLNGGIINHLLRTCWVGNEVTMKQHQNVWYVVFLLNNVVIVKFHLWLRLVQQTCRRRINLLSEACNLNNKAGPSSQRTQSISITKINRLQVFRECCLLSK